MRFYIVAELRESYPSYTCDGNVYNDYVSKKSINDLIDGITNIGYNCAYLGGMKELYQAYIYKKFADDMIFINYNYGLPSQYKRVQGPALLELMKVKYSGSNPFTSLLVNDKAYCKKLLSNLQIFTPKGKLLHNEEEVKKYFNYIDLTLPVIVKPNLEGSSLGIDDNCFCTSYDSAMQKIYHLLNKFPQVLIEEYIAGYECTVWIIGNEQNFPFIMPLIISENQKYYFENKIFTLKDKAKHSKNYNLPSNILPNSVVENLKILSKKIFIELGLRDYARIDFRIKNNDIYFIEANALPIFSKTSEIGAITNLYSITYEEICNILINVLLKRFNVLN